MPKTDHDRAHPYACLAGFWASGYGHLCDPKHPPITVDEAESYLASNLTTTTNTPPRYSPVLATESVGRLAAIVDFKVSFVAGLLQTSKLRRRINQRDWIATRQELR